ncbi:hypothetical protein [Arthrobacter wenxiniae]|nr:hypothetical protein [Arthrobacter wenxiniae]
MDPSQARQASPGLRAGPTAAAVVGFLVLVELTSGATLPGSPPQR